MTILLTVREKEGMKRWPSQGHIVISQYLHTILDLYIIFVLRYYLLHIIGSDYRETTMHVMLHDKR